MRADKKSKPRGAASQPGSQPETYPGRSQLLVELERRTRKGDHEAVHELHDLDAAFMSQVRHARRWEDTSLRVQSGAIRFLESGFELWPDIPRDLAADVRSARRGSTRTRRAKSAAYLALLVASLGSTGLMWREVRAESSRSQALDQRADELHQQELLLIQDRWELLNRQEASFPPEWNEPIYHSAPEEN